MPNRQPHSSPKLPKSPAIPRQLQDRLLLLFCFTLAPAALIWNFSGARGSDDLSYSLIAWEIVEKGLPLPPENSWQARLGFVVPLATVQGILGTHEASNALIPVISFFLLGALLSKWVPADGPTWLRFAPLVLLSMMPALLALGTQAMTDLPALATTTTAFALLIRGRRRRHWSTAGLLFGLAYLIRESSVISVPAAVALTLLACRRRRRVAPLICFGLGLILLPSLEMIVYHQITGDHLHRLSLAETQHNDSIHSSKDLSGTEILKRIVYKRWLQTIGSEGFGTVPLWLLAVLFALGRHLGENPTGRAVLIWLVVEGAALTLATTSLDFYNLLPLSDRFQLPILPPLIVAALTAITQGSHQPAQPTPVDRAALVVVAGLTFLPLYSLLRGAWESSTLQLAILVPPLVLLGIRLLRRGLSRRWAIGLGLLPALIHLVMSSWHAPGRDRVLEDERRVVQLLHAGALQEPLFSDVRTLRSVAFLVGDLGSFHRQRVLTDRSCGGTALLNRRVSARQQILYGQKPPIFLAETPSSWLRIGWIPDGGALMEGDESMAIYRLPSCGPPSVEPRGAESSTQTGSPASRHGL